MLPSFARDVVTIHRPKLCEERGAQVKDYSDASTHVVTSCSFQPSQSSTNWTDPRQAVTVRAVLFAPPSADIKRDDLVEFDGVKYAIEGAPHSWKSPSGRVDHIQCSLIDWEG